MAIGPNELRQCPARHGQRMTLQCQGEVTEQTTHLGDHWAFEPDGSGNKIFWTELIAMYPVPDDVRASDSTMGAEVVREKLAEKGIGNGSARQGQVGGDHYRKHKIQPWDIWEAYGLNAFEGSIIKYLLRYKDKNGVEDLKKARHTLDKLIELEEARSGG